MTTLELVKSSSSGPQKIRRKESHIYKVMGKSIFYIYSKRLIVCYHETPRYYDKEVQIYHIIE
jgi:hypothetical protein